VGLDPNAEMLPERYSHPNTMIDSLYEQFQTPKIQNFFQKKLMKNHSNDNLNLYIKLPISYTLIENGYDLNAIFDLTNFQNISHCCTVIW
jgi:hypothetical protein